MISRNNIVFIIADDHRFDAGGALGTAEIATPYLDKLVEQGTTLTHTYIMGSTSPAVCTPSRAMLLTGRSLFRALTTEGGPYRFPHYVKLFPELLRESGYHTYAVGKWHNHKDMFARCFEGGATIFFGGMSDHDKVPIFDFDTSGTYPPEQQYLGTTFSTELFGDAAIEFLTQYREDRPFFLHLAFTAPHDPRTPPVEYRYDPARISLPRNFMPQHPFDNGELHIRDEELAPFPRTPENIQQHLADYYGMISHLDAKIGQIMQALDQSPHADNTYVIYAADHGIAVGQHGLMGKQNMYDHSLRVPLIIRGPGIPAGQKRDALCYLYDLFPTMSEWADIALGPTNEGQSLNPLISGQKSTHRSSIFAAYQPNQEANPDSSFQRMVRQGRYKLVEYFVEGERHTQLFDLVDDPSEMNNLTGTSSYSGVLKLLRQQLHTWQHIVDDPCRGII